MMGVVYFLRRQSGLIKIGRSRDFETRRRSIAQRLKEPVEVLAVVPGGPQLEAKRHREFADDRIEGEWFIATPALLSRISELTKIAPSKPMPDLLFARAWRERGDAQTFLATLAEKVLHDRVTDTPRLAALKNLGAAAGVSDSFIRHLISDPKSVRAEADFMLRLVEVYEAHCVEAAMSAEQRARDLRRECEAVREWSDCFAVPAKMPPDSVVAPLVGEGGQ